MPLRPLARRLVTGGSMLSTSQRPAPTLRVLMAGPNPLGRGGMASVARLLVGHCPPDVDLRFVTTFDDGPPARRIALWLLALPRFILELLRKPAVVHLHVSERGSVLRKGVLTLLARMVGVPVVLHCHGAEFGTFYDRTPALLRCAVTAVFRCASAVLVLGQQWEQVYVGRVGVAQQRIRVLSNPVELPARVPERSGAGLLFLGRFGDRKGAKDVVRAVAELSPRTRSGLRVWMHGDGEVEQVRALAAALRVDGIVAVGGWLEPTARDELLARCSVFVLPSRNEGIPVALLEAMGWGLVPVVTPVGGIPELVHQDKNGLLVEPGDVAGLASALARVIEDDELRGRLGTAARRSVEPLGVDRYLASMTQVWRYLARR